MVSSSGLPAFPGRPPGAAGTPAIPVANPGQVTPNLPAWVIGNGGNSYGWLEPEKSQTTSRHIMFSGLAGEPLPWQHPIADALSPDPARRYSSLLRIRAHFPLRDATLDRAAELSRPY